MSTKDTVRITTELLATMEKSSGLVELSTEQEFLEALKLNKAIIYFLVDWSGPERLSRYCVYKALNELAGAGTPVFKVDCSDQTKEYVVAWLMGQRENMKHFYYSGYGETLRISNGSVLDVIRYPGQLGFEKTKETLLQWK